MNSSLLTDPRPRIALFALWVSSPHPAALEGRWSSPYVWPRRWFGKGAVGPYTRPDRQRGGRGAPAVRRVGPAPGGQAVARASRQGARRRALAGARAAAPHSALHR